MKNRKYAVVLAANNMDFYTHIMPDLLPGRERLKTLNALLDQLSLDPSKKSPPITLATIEAFLKAGGVAALALHKESVVGFGCLVPVTKINGVTGRIEHVVVDTPHRGAGVSKRIMKMLIKEARTRGYRYLDLTTEETRVAANNLYTALSFKLRRTNPYRLTL